MPPNVEGPRIFNLSVVTNGEKRGPFQYDPAFEYKLPLLLSKMTFPAPSDDSRGAEA